MNCPNCGVPLMGEMVICPKCKFDTRTKDGGEAFKEKQRRKELGIEPPSQEELIRKAKEEEERHEFFRREMILTTCPSVEGYRIKRQCGLVFGEVAFKTGFFKSLGAAFDNIGDLLSAGSKELSGTARLLADAREYAMNKIKDDAINRGANAIIGIDSESSIGGDIMHVTIYGTAVEIEKIGE